MKKLAYTIGICMMAALLSSNAAYGQEVASKTSDEKLKQIREAEELQKKQQANAEEKQAQLTEIQELQKKQQVVSEEYLKKAQLKEKETLKVTKEKELAKKIAEIEAELADSIDDEEIDRIMRDYERQRIRTDVRSYSPYIGLPDEKSFHYSIPYIDNFYIVGHEKSGSSWNYSRQVLEATFINEFTMDATGDEGTISLAVSGDCAEGSIAVAVITPDGKQLSEVVIDANGSLNWRKSFDREENKWKSGKWIFRITAKKATGNFRLNMTAN